MNGEQTSKNLTVEQKEKLISLLEELGSFPVAETIVRCFEIVGFDPTIEEEKKRADVAFAGAWAFDRTLLYLDRLRSLNQERMQLGAEIHRLKQIPPPTTEAEIEEAAWARVMEPHLAGKQEVVIHFFCISVQHIRSLLSVAATAVGYEIPADDLAFLDEFRALRNHFEHWYSRLPGMTGEVGLVTKSLTEHEYRVSGGLKKDEQDRVIVIEPKKPIPVKHAAAVTNRGFARVEKIVQEAASQIKELAIERVRTHFTAHPDNIPSPDDVRQELLFSAGGFEPDPTDENPAG